eukprot:GHUV01018041.1.p1 GENE.GHUV01018041.1~~GHUV01018041.1.p1  ORF type:complete len:200 (+),score=28.89 GHUV01018041.1:172-771(+)
MPSVLLPGCITLLSTASTAHDCRFQAVKQLHMTLLIISLVAAVLFFIVLYRPYIKQLHRDSKAVVGMLSQLPAEVDVEGHVKAIILGVSKPIDVGGQSMLVGPSGGSMMMMMPPGPAGYGPPPGAYPPPPQGGRFGSQPGMGGGGNPNMYQQGAPAGYNNGDNRWGPPPGQDYGGRGSATGWQGPGAGAGKRGSWNGGY